MTDQVHVLKCKNLAWVIMWSLQAAALMSLTTIVAVTPHSRHMWWTISVSYLAACMSPTLAVLILKRYAYGLLMLLGAVDSG